MKQSIVLMTALLPTDGHMALINFASNFVGPNGHVQVIISARSFEPIPGKDRLKAFRDEYGHYHFNVDFDLHEDDFAPQNPKTDEEWEYWKNVCETIAGTCPPVMKYDYFVSSEPYGKKMAEILGCQFVPFDIMRRITPVKSSIVRKNIMSNFHKIMHSFRPFLTTKFTLFGQESTGKTTMTEYLGMYNPTMISTTHEFARPYLEGMDDKTVTNAKMADIAQGQYALMKTNSEAARCPVIVQDTDLLSTIGYYRIYGGKCDLDINQMFRETKSDLYFVMSDDVPFQKDALRYGGEVRESTKEFWIDLLKEYNCNYVEVPMGTLQEQYDFIRDKIIKIVLDKFRPISEFERE